MWKSLTTRKAFFLLLFSGVFLQGCGSVPNPTSEKDSDFILDLADFKTELADRADGPALSSALKDPKPWESYNQWMCFKSKDVQVERVQIKYPKKWKWMPQISIIDKDRTLSMSPEADLDFNTEVAIDKLNNLLSNSEQICTYAAFLSVDKAGSNGGQDTQWVLRRIKSKNGTWDAWKSALMESR